MQFRMTVISPAKAAELTVVDLGHTLLGYDHRVPANCAGEEIRAICGNCNNLLALAEQRWSFDNFAFRCAKCRCYNSNPALSKETRY